MTSIDPLSETFDRNGWAQIPHRLWAFVGGEVVRTYAYVACIAKPNRSGERKFWLGQERTASALGISTRQLRRHLVDLEACGAITVERRRRQSSIITISEETALHAPTKAVQDTPPLVDPMTVTLRDTPKAGAWFEKHSSQVSGMTGHAATDVDPFERTSPTLSRPDVRRPTDKEDEEAPSAILEEEEIATPSRHERAREDYPHELAAALAMPCNNPEDETHLRVLGRMLESIEDPQRRNLLKRRITTMDGDIESALILVQDYRQAVL